MYYCNIKEYDTADGYGIRTTLVVSGCRNACEGCQNKVAWDFKYGKEMKDEDIELLMSKVDKFYCKGLSIIGGEPFDPLNQEGVLKVISKFREKFGTTKDLWCWTGYSLESDLLDPKGKARTDITDKMLSEIDYLVDGPFILKKRNPNLAFRGSGNQRVLQRTSEGFKEVQVDKD